MKAIVYITLAMACLACPIGEPKDVAQSAFVVGQVADFWQQSALALLPVALPCIALLALLAVTLEVMLVLAGG